MYAVKLTIAALSTSALGPCAVVSWEDDWGTAYPTSNR